MLPSQIMEYVAALPEGTPVRAKQLVHLGSRNAVDQALRRLQRKGALVKVGWGLYAAPTSSRWGTRPPAPSKLARALAAQEGERLAPSPMLEAGALGLTEQIPYRDEWLTSGRSRVLRSGERVTVLKQVPSWLLLDGVAGQVVRALHWLGRARALGALDQVRDRLSEADIAALLDLRARLPAWMSEAISGLVVHAP